MALDYDKIHYASSIPAYMNVQNGSFSFTVSGSLSASATSQFTGNTTANIASGSVKIYIRQTPVPSDIFTDYTSDALLPVPPLGQGFSGFPPINVGCSVSGNPSVTSITVHVATSLSTSGITTVITINNPYAGTMTLTSTTFTVLFSVFAPTYTP